MLAAEGYNVLTADSARKALKQIARGLEPDAILLDIGMPDMTGLAFLREISDENDKPKFPVVILTARPNLDDFFADLSVSGFLAKPCTQADMLAALRRAIGASAADARQPALAPVPASSGKKIVLLVEDDIRVRARLGKALTASYTVKEISRGAEVVEAAAAYQPDVVVLNKILTGINGDKIAQQLIDLPAAKDIPVVMYEDGADPESARRSLLRAHNVSEFVSSIQSDPIMTAVRSAVGG